MPNSFEDCLTVPSLLNLLLFFHFLCVLLFFSTLIDFFCFTFYLLSYSISFFAFSFVILLLSPFLYSFFMSFPVVVTLFIQCFVSLHFFFRCIIFIGVSVFAASIPAVIFSYFFVRFSNYYVCLATALIFGLLQLRNIRFP